MIKKYKISEKNIRQVIGLLMMHLFVTLSVHAMLTAFFLTNIGIETGLVFFILYAPSLLAGIFLTYFYLTRVYLYKEPDILKKLGVDVIE